MKWKPLNCEVKFLNMEFLINYSRYSVSYLIGEFENCAKYNHILGATRKIPSIDPYLDP